jgi:hypothetical protein
LETKEKALSGSKTTKKATTSMNLVMFDMVKQQNPKLNELQLRENDNEVQRGRIKKIRKKKKTCWQKRR